MITYGATFVFLVFFLAPGCFASRVSNGSNDAEDVLWSAVSMGDYAARYRAASPRHTVAEQFAAAFPLPSSSSFLHEQGGLRHQRCAGGRKGEDVSATACLQVDLDLTCLGAPGSMVSLGLKGTLGYNYCTSCWSWEFEAKLAYLFGVQIFGKHFGVGAEVTGKVKIDEVTCAAAPDTDYCTQLMQLLPEDKVSGDQVMAQCHTSNPFSLVLSYISFKMKQLKDKLGGDDGYISRFIPTFETQLEKELNKLEPAFRAYKDKFLKVDKTDYLARTGHFDGQMFLRILKAAMQESKQIKEAKTIPSTWVKVTAAYKQRDAQYRKLSDFATSVKQSWIPEWNEGKQYPFSSESDVYQFDLEVVQAKAKNPKLLMLQLQVFKPNNEETTQLLVCQGKCSTQSNYRVTKVLPLSEPVFFEAKAGGEVAWLEFELWINLLPQKSYSMFHFTTSGAPHYYSIHQDALSPMFVAYDLYAQKLESYASQVLDLLLDNDDDEVPQKERLISGARHLARYPKAKLHAIMPGLKERESQGNAWCAGSGTQSKEDDGNSSLVRDLLVGPVLNIPKAVRFNQRIMSDEGAFQDVNYFADLATSLGNLFLRAVGDMQALFNLYFADDPHWDGDCYSLKPRFQMMFEEQTGQEGKGPKSMYERFERFFGRSKKGAGSSTQNGIKHRVAEGGGFSQKGAVEKDAENPWCQRAWAAGSSFPPETLFFADADSPTGGKDGFQLQEREMAGTMYPHLWCELAANWRILPPDQRYTVKHCGKIPNLQHPCRVDNSGPQPVPEEELAWSTSTDAFAKRGRATQGRTLRFNAACRQTRNGDLEYLEECEQVVLSVPFQTIFPDFIKAVHVAFHAIGTMLEDALQCAQLLTKSSRQFEQNGGGNIDIELLKCNAEGERLQIVRAKSEDVLHTLRRFLLQMGAKDARQAQRPRWMTFEERRIAVSDKDRLNNLAQLEDPKVEVFKQQLREVQKKLFINDELRDCCSFQMECSQLMPLACSDPDGSLLASMPVVNPRGLLDQNFYQAFAFVVEPNGRDPILTGNVYAALQIVDNLLSREVSLKERVKRAKQHLAMKFRMQSIAAGEDKALLLYPQFQYKTQVEFAFMLNLGSKIDFCMQRDTSVKFGITPRWSGDSWSEAKAQELCGWGSGTIVGHSLRIERCWSTESPGDGRTFRSDIWRFQIAAFVEDMSLIDLAMEKIRPLLKKAQDSVGGALQSANLGFLTDSGSKNSLLKKLASITLIKFMISMLSKSFSLPWGAISSTGVGDEVKAIWGEVVRIIKSTVLSVQNFLADAWDWLREHVSLDIKMRSWLTGTLTLSKESGADAAPKFSKAFDVAYMKQYAALMKIKVPAVVSIQFMAALNLRQDLSSGLNSVLALVDGVQFQSRYDTCVRCLATGAGFKAYCPKALSGIRQDDIELTQQVDANLPVPFSRSKVGARDSSSISNPTEGEISGKDILQTLGENLTRGDADRARIVRCASESIVEIQCADIMIARPQDCVALLTHSR
mmetsp:Transcript_124629/g.248722  ORF Transcript_124629/g.248722 Transcript_124629/m.248722 type:complete len:1502 (-) Transcript_124629:42-4547(-)